MSPKETVKYKSARNIALVIGFLDKTIDRVVARGGQEALYTLIHNNGYRWSADLAKWTPIKRGDKSMVAPKVYRRQFVNLSAWVAESAVSTFIEEWRNLAELADYAVVKEYQGTGRDNSSMVKVYLRFRRAVKNGKK